MKPCEHKHRHTADVMAKECSDCHEILEHPWSEELARLRAALERIKYLSGEPDVEAIAIEALRGAVQPTAPQCMECEDQGTDWPCPSCGMVRIHAGAVSVLKPQGTEETGNDRPAAPSLKLAEPDIDDWTIPNLVMFINRLAHLLHKYESPCKAVDQAYEFLDRKRIPNGSPLRAADGWQDIHKAATEIERLTAAVRAIYEVWAGSDGFVPETAPEAYQERLIHQMRDIAREALKERT